MYALWKGGGIHLRVAHLLLLLCERGRREGGGGFKNIGTEKEGMSPGGGEPNNSHSSPLVWVLSIFGFPHCPPLEPVFSWLVFLVLSCPFLSLFSLVFVLIIVGMAKEASIGMPVLVAVTGKLAVFSSECIHIHRLTNIDNY
jgi:hypothetical protein